MFFVIGGDYSPPLIYFLPIPPLTHLFHFQPLTRKYYGSENITYVVEVRKDVLGDPVNPIINLTHPEQPENPNSGFPWRQEKVSGGEAERLVFRVRFRSKFYF